MAQVFGSASDSAIAHGLHYSIVFAGLLGLVLLLVPALVGSRRRRPGPAAGDTTAQPGNEPDARSMMLRSEVASGPPSRRSNHENLAQPTTRAERAWASLWRPQPIPTAQRVLLPLAVVGSAAAAGVHAAVGAAHLRDGLVVGTTFALAALGQLAWVGAASVQCSRALLRIGALGNIAILTLWALRQTVALPGEVLTQSQAAGPWDVAGAAWELVVVVSCLALLTRTHIGCRLPAWPDWHLGVRAFVFGSVALLGVLSLGGAGA